MDSRKREREERERIKRRWNEMEPLRIQQLLTQTLTYLKATTHGTRNESNDSMDVRERERERERKREDERERKKEREREREE